MNIIVKSFQQLSFLGYRCIILKENKIVYLPPPWSFDWTGFES